MSVNNLKIRPHLQFLSSQFTHFNMNKQPKIRRIGVKVLSFPFFNNISNWGNLYLISQVRPKAVNANMSGSAIDTDFSIFYGKKHIVQFLSVFNKSVQPHFIDGLGTFEAKRPRKLENFSKFTFTTGLTELSEETRIKHVFLLPQYDLIPYKLQISIIFGKHARIRSSESLIRMYCFPVRIF